MSKSTIIRTNENKLLSFRHENSNIYLYAFENNIWVKKEAIVSEVCEDFTINIDTDDNIYMFSRDNANNVNYSHYNKTKWTTKSILKITQNLDIPILFYPFLYDDVIHLIYNMVKDDTNYILYQKMVNNNWSKPQTIDSFTPLRQTSFQIIKASKDYLLIFYKKGYSIGYKELSLKLGKSSIFNIIHTTNYYIGDQSLLIKNNVIHILYTLKSMFSVQLIYKQKTDTDFSAPYVIWEGQRIDDAIIFAIENKIIITFITPQGLYYGVSTNDGITFSKFSKLKSLENEHLTKCLYITNENTYNKLNTNEVYINKHGNVSIIPDMCENFYPFSNQEEQSPNFLNHSEDGASAVSTKQKKIVPDDGLIVKYQEKILQYKNELQQKDIVIMKLEGLVQQKKNELDLLNRDFKDEFKKVSNQNKDLIEKNKVLECNIKQLEAENKKIVDEMNELIKNVKQHEIPKNEETIPTSPVEPYIEDALETIE